MMFTKIKNICRYYWLLPEKGEGKEEGWEGEEGFGLGVTSKRTGGKGGWSTLIWSPCHI